MITIKPNMDAEMVLGDTGTFFVAPKIDNKTFLTKGDELYFTMKKLKEQSIVIQKKITEFIDGEAMIEILPEETKNMESGNYIYDLKLIRSDGTTDTLIKGRPYAYFSLKRGVK